MGREVLADGHKPPQLPALSISCGCGLTAECLPATEDRPGAIPGSRTILTDKPGTSGAAESPKLCLLGAAPRRLAKGVVADK